MTQELPKYKTIGLITAHAATGAPTALESKFDVAWVTGLEFRNTKIANGATAALCITPIGHNPHLGGNGLHLAPDAARQLSGDLELQAWGAVAVDVDNHDDGEVNVWKRFSATDAMTLGKRIADVVADH